MRKVNTKHTNMKINTKNQYDEYTNEKQYETSIHTKKTKLDSNNQYEKSIRKIMKNKTKNQYEK